MGPTVLVPLRRKACWGIFRQENPTASAGFEPANSGTEAAVKNTNPDALNSYIRKWIQKSGFYPHPPNPFLRQVWISWCHIATMNKKEYPFYTNSFISSGPSNLKAGGNKYRSIQMTFPRQLFLYFTTFCKQDHCILLTWRFNIFFLRKAICFTSEKIYIRTVAVALLNRTQSFWEVNSAILFFSLSDIK